MSSLYIAENLEIAKKIVEYVTTKIPYSDNTGSRDSTRLYLEDCHRKGIPILRRDEILNELDKIREEVDKIEDPSDKLKLWANLAEKTGVGNCIEMAVLGYQFAKETAELFEIVNGDHVFLVIGRDKCSGPKDFVKWGPHAVICDPWAEKCYPAVDLEHHLESYIEELGTTQPFDKTYQSLAIYIRS